MIPAAEEIELLSLKAVHQSASEEIRESLGIDSIELDGGVISIASELPSSAIVINRCMAMGLQSGLAEEELRDIVAAYERAGVERFFIQIHPQAQSDFLPLWMLDMNLEQARGWQKFSRGRETFEPSSESHNIREITTDQGADSAQIVCSGFDLGDAAVPWLAALPGAAKWHVFVEYDGDQPMATGALYMDGDTAWTDFGATSPDCRKRGCQLALLKHRIEFALDNGCQQIFTCTGEDVPGDPQHSYSNILRAGFKETYIRENFSPPKPR